MADRPILFSAPMVRAILAGTKTQTRRAVKPMPGLQSEWLTAAGIVASPKLTIARSGEKHPGEGPLGAAMDHPEGGPLGWVRCPYGEPGDRLWVKETWRPWLWGGGDSIETAGDVEIEYAADSARHHAPEAPSEWVFPKASARGNVSPLFMPRWASRILLEITDVRVQRLQDISEADAQAEGADPIRAKVPTHRDAFRYLWDDINGFGAWNFNPWVWAVNFQRVAP